MRPWIPRFFDVERLTNQDPETRLPAHARLKNLLRAFPDARYPVGRLLSLGLTNCGRGYRTHVYQDNHGVIPAA